MKLRMLFATLAAVCVILPAQEASLPATQPPAASAPPEKVKIYVPGKDVAAPELLPVDYSNALADNCEQTASGEAELSLIVDSAGAAQQVQLVKPIGNDLDKLALKLIRADRFKPAQLNGAPVAAGLVARIKLDACIVTVTDASGQAVHRIRPHTTPQQQFDAWTDAPEELVPNPPPVLTKIAPGIYRIGGSVTAPRVLHEGVVHFSEEAKHAKYQGEALVTVIVDEKGLPQNPHVVRPIGMGLDEKAIEAVKEYRFTPAMKDGKPVPVYMTIAINFRLY